MRELEEWHLFVPFGSCLLAGKETRDPSFQRLREPGPVSSLCLYHYDSPCLPSELNGWGKEGMWEMKMEGEASILSRWSHLRNYEGFSHHINSIDFSFTFPFLWFTPHLLSILSSFVHLTQRRGYGVKERIKMEWLSLPYNSLLSLFSIAFLWSIFVRYLCQNESGKRWKKRAWERKRWEDKDTFITWSFSLPSISLYLMSTCWWRKGDRETRGSGFMMYLPSFISSFKYK